MPEQEGYARRRLEWREGPLPPIPRAPFVELGLTTPFSFLRGASDAVELIPQAMNLGMDAIGVADRNTLAGVVRIHSNAKTAGVKPLIGCRLVVDAPLPAAETWSRSAPTPRPRPRPRGRDRTSRLPPDREGYARLSRLLSLGQGRAIKGECDLTLADVAAHAEGIAFIAWPGEDLDRFEAQLPLVRAALPGLRHVAATHLYRGDDLARIERLDRFAKSSAAPSSPPTTSIITRPPSARCRTY